MSRATESPLVQAERRSWRYWNEDGIPLMLMGAVCTAIVGCVILLRNLKYGHWLMWIPFFCGTLLMVKVREMAEWLKARYVWPRTGYAAAPFFADMTTAVPPDVLSIRPEDQAEMELRRMRRRHQLRQSFAASLVAVFLPQAVVRSGQSGLNAAYVALALGAAAALMGLIRLAIFLRRHPLESA